MLVSVTSADVTNIHSLSECGAGRVLRGKGMCPSLQQTCIACPSGRQQSVVVLNACVTKAKKLLIPPLCGNVTRNGLQQTRDC